MHHCDSWRIKDQLDVTCYFISLLMCSTCFRHSYIHHQELATILLNYHIGRIVLGSICVGVSVCLGWSGICVVGWSTTGLFIRASACNTDTTPNQPHRNSNTHRTKNNTTNVVFQQNSRKLPMMDIWKSETCWAHKKWNKIASDIKLVFYSSNIFLPLFFFLLSSVPFLLVCFAKCVLKINEIISYLYLHFVLLPSKWISKTGSRKEV